MVIATTVAATTTVTRTRAIGAAEAALTAAATVAAAIATAFITAATITAIAITAAKATFTAETTAITAGARRTGFHGARFIHDEAAATQGLAIHALNGSLCFRFTGHFHKTKAFGAAGVSFHHDARTCDSSKLAERLLQIVVAHTIGKVADIQLIAH